jgi:di/tricarboxylate transporter
MDATVIFAHMVLVFILTTILYVFFENKNNIKFPILEEQLKKESKHRFLISLGVSLLIVIIFMLLKIKK